MQGRDADRPARRDGRARAAGRHSPGAAPLPRHPRQPHREDQQLLQESGPGVRLQRRELHNLPHKGEPDAARGRGDNKPRAQVQPRARGRLQARAPRRHRRAVPERLAHHLQRIQGPELHRACPARPEDGQAHIHSGREAQRARHHSPRGQEARREAQPGHTHKAGLVGQRQVGRQRRRRQQVRTDEQRAARGARAARQEEHARMPQADTLPHRQPDNEDTPHTGRPARGVAVLHTVAQDGIQRRLRRLRRRARRRLRRHTLAQQRELRELLHTGVCQRLHLHLRRGSQQERPAPPQHHNRERPLAHGTPLGARNRRARDGVAARDARGIRAHGRQPPARARPVRHLGQPEPAHHARRLARRGADTRGVARPVQPRHSRPARTRRD